MSGFFNYPWRPLESLLFLRSLVYHVTSHYSSTIIVCIPPSDQVIFFFVGLSIGLLFLGVKSWKERKRKSLPAIECFHMTSRRPYWCPKTMKRRPFWCPKPILWELNSFLMQTLSFVPINLHRCWPREWKHSIVIAINCHVSWKICLLPRLVQIPELLSGNFMISKVTPGIRNAFLLIKTNSTDRFDRTSLLGFRDLSLPLNVSPEISIRPISVYLQNPAKRACGSYGETPNLYFP